MITLALTPRANPKTVADVIARTKIGVWNLSPSCRLYAKEEIDKPRMRHAMSINAGGGSRIHSKWPEPTAGSWICSPESGTLIPWKVYQLEQLQLHWGLLTPFS